MLSDFRWQLVSIVELSVVIGIVLLWSAKKLYIQKGKSWRLWITLGVIIVFAMPVGFYFQFHPRKPDGGTIGVHLRKDYIAVMPFEDISPNRDQKSLCKGMTEEIIGKLSNIKAIKVIGRTSVMWYKNKDKSIKEIGQGLNVATILEGSIQKEGGYIRVRARLINTENNLSLWSNNYDRKLESIFKIQSDVAKRIASVLHARLSPEEKRRIEKEPTENLEAYDFYKRGIDYENNVSMQENYRYRLAVQMYERAIELDPNFSLAYARLSRAHSSLFFLGHDKTEKRWKKAKEAADRAIELDPNLPEAHVALGLYYYYCHLDYEHALEEYSVAQEYLPNNPRLFASIGYIQRRQGKFEKALVNLKNALEQDRHSTGLAHQIGMIYLKMRQYQEAEKHLNLAVSNAPNVTVYNAHMSFLYLLWHGNTEKARDVLEKALSGTHPEMIFSWIQLNLAERKYQEALSRLSSLTVESFDWQGWSYPSALWAAIICQLVGQHKQARAYYDSARIFLEKKLEHQPEDERLYGPLGIALAGLGRKDKAKQVGMRGIELQPVSKEAWQGPWRIREFAQILVMVEEYDAAIEQIQYLLSIPSFISVSWLKIDPIWDPLRGHPRFQKLLEQDQKQEDDSEDR